MYEPNSKKILSYYNDIEFIPGPIFLHKDIGTVPLVIARHKLLDLDYIINCKHVNVGFTSFLSYPVFQCKKLFQSLPYQLDFLKSLKTYAFLLTRINSYEILYLTPFVPLTDLLFCIFFKLLNPCSRVVIKLDANYEVFTTTLIKLRKPIVPTLPISAFSYLCLFLISDIIFYETHAVGKLLYKVFSGNWKRISKKINCLYNGVSSQNISSFITNTSSSHTKENIIVFSGRLDSPDKNIEFVLKTNFIPHGWQCHFIGPVSAYVQQLIHQYRLDPERFDRTYKFHGLIEDKSTYYELLMRAKILLVTSKKEGFPMIYAEAHYFRLLIVTSLVSGAYEATHRGRYGFTYPINSESGYIDAIQHAVKSTTILDTYDYEEFRKSFIWEYSIPFHLL